MSVRFTVGRAVTVLFLLAVVLTATFLLALLLGEQPLSFSEAFTAGTTDAAILWSLRLPRALLAGIVGAALAASGCALQALMRNPLADPFVLGVSGGAALGATVALALGLGTLTAASGPTGSIFQASATSAFALVGSLGATALVLTLGKVAGARSPHTTLLCGVIFNSFALAVIIFIKALAAPDKLGEILYWLAGTLGYERGWTLAATGAFEVIAIGAMWAASGRLNLLTLGDEEAASLGVHVERTRLFLLVAASLAVSAAVALSGLVGFVGLIVPHVLRLWLGPDQRLLLPASALGGAAFLVFADLCARLLFRVFHEEPPVGGVTALLGVPFFFLLLYRGRRA
ncbi:MAG: FecCD family ABC transporter permease [Myxococcota bacterium]